MTDSYNQRDINLSTVDETGGENWKLPARVATLVAGVLATDFEVGDIVDGIALALDDRILIKDQADPTENGIYVVRSIGVPLRSADADMGGQLVGAIIPVTEGVVNDDTLWMQVTNAPITVGTSPINWIENPMTSLQEAYDNSPPVARTIILAAGAGQGINIEDNVAPIGTALLQVTDSGGGTVFFSADAAGIDVGGDADITALMRSLNNARGAGDPNTVVTAPLSSIFQQDDAAGVLWVNTDGATAWALLAASVVNLQTAYDASPAGARDIVLAAGGGQGVNIEDNAAPIGTNLFQVTNNGGGTVFFSADVAGIDVDGDADITALLRSLNNARGAGDPNAVVTAPLSSIYQQDDALGVWVNTDGATAWVQVVPSSITLQAAYDASAVGARLITLADGATEGLEIRDSAAGDADPIFSVNDNAGTTGFLQVNGAGQTLLGATAALGTETLLVYSGAALPAIIQNDVDDDARRVNLQLLRTRSSATAPGAGFGGSLSFNLEGFTDGSSPAAGTISTIWEVAQTNDTTDRDSTLGFTTMQGNVTNEVMRLNSAQQVLIGATVPTATELLHVAGDTLITGKLTVTGLIDPTGFVGSEQAVTPYSPATVLTGTVTVAALATAVLGVGTLFTAELVALDFVVIGTETHQVALITDDFNLTLVTPHVAGAAGVTISLEGNEGTFWVDDSNPTRFMYTSSDGIDYVVLDPSTLGLQAAYEAENTIVTSVAFGNFDVSGTEAISMVSGVGGISLSSSDSGAASLSGGNSTTVQGGDASLVAGTSTVGDGGQISISAGDTSSAAGTESGGPITIVAGDGFLGDGSSSSGGSITVTAGTTRVGTPGSISLIAGASDTISGNINMTAENVVITGDASISGKLTVAGLIDPTGFVGSEQAVTPYSPATVLTGTVTVAALATAVLGVGTLFTAELVALDFVVIAGETHQVASIGDDLNLTLVTPHVAGAAGVAISLEGDEGTFWVDDSNPTRFMYTSSDGVDYVVLDPSTLGLQAAYEAGNTIDTSVAFGNFDVSGTEAISMVSGVGGISLSSSDSGAASLSGGNSTTVQGGDASLVAGTSTVGDGGQISISAGDTSSAAGTESGGPITIVAGDGFLGDGSSSSGGSITVTAGTTRVGAPGSISFIAGASDTILGNINMTAENVVITGDASISGKLTVAGLIDPTGFVGSEQATTPYSPSTVLTGTVTVAALGTVVTGVLTLFLSELAALDFVVIAGETHQVASIGTDLSLTLATPHVAGAAGVAISLEGDEGTFWVDNSNPARFMFTSSDGVDYVVLDPAAGGNDLAGVLVAGNLTGGSDIEVTTGDSIVGTAAATGGAVPIVGGAGSGGTGGAVSLTGGEGTTVGGGITVIAGAAAAASAGNGGAISIDGGDGDGVGNGGDVDITGGDGGVNGGDMTLAGGVGTGTGGRASLTGGICSAGQGGEADLAGGTGTTIGGAAVVIGGSASAGVGGQVLVQGGVGTTTGGAVNINGGVGSSAVGGAITITGGTGQTDGGAAALIGGTGTGANDGGDVDVTGGVAGATGGGGRVDIRGGVGTTVGSGGNISIVAGMSGGGNAGFSTMSGGRGGAATPGGLVGITGGSGLSFQAGDARVTGGTTSTGIAGDAVISGGTAGGAGDSGSVFLTTFIPGSGAGTTGLINLSTGAGRAGMPGGSITLSTGDGGNTEDGGNIILDPGVAGGGGGSPVDGIIDAQGNVVVTGQAYSIVNALADGANIATNCNLSNSHTVTLGGNRTLSDPTNMEAGSTYIWQITQDGAGSRTLAYGAAFTWPGGVAPTLSTGAGDIDLITAYCPDGATLRATFNLNFS